MVWMKKCLVSVRDNAVKVDLYLKSFVPLKDKPFFYRLWMDIEELKDKIKIGETFEGKLFVGRSENTKIVDRKDVIIKDGKRYLLMEIRPGLISDNQLEVLSPTKNFLPPDLLIENTMQTATSTKKQITHQQKDEQVKSTTNSAIKKQTIIKKTNSINSTKKTAPNPKKTSKTKRNTKEVSDGDSAEESTY